MPYIKKERREILNSKTQFPEIRTPGELNYMIVRLICFYLTQKPRLCYTDYNEVIGVLECVKQEFFRRRINPYEEEKRKLNGEVFFEK